MKPCISKLRTTSPLNDFARTCLLHGLALHDDISRNVMMSDKIRILGAVIRRISFEDTEEFHSLPSYPLYSSSSPCLASKQGMSIKCTCRSSMACSWLSSQRLNSSQAIKHRKSSSPAAEYTTVTFWWPPCGFPCTLSAIFVEIHRLMDLESACSRPLDSGSRSTNVISQCKGLATQYSSYSRFPCPSKGFIQQLQPSIVDRVKQMDERMDLTAMSPDEGPPLESREGVKLKKCFFCGSA